VAQLARLAAGSFQDAPAADDPAADPGPDEEDDQIIETSPRPFASLAPRSRAHVVGDGDG
jgi:hypothetical protein